MRGLASRIGRLESNCNLAGGPRRVFRVVVSAIAMPLNLENSKCTRTLQADGALLEVVQLDGTCRGLSEAELDEFVQSFPVQPAAR
jgi:hypothetical protein